MMPGIWPPVSLPSTLVNEMDEKDERNLLMLCFVNWTNTLEEVLREQSDGKGKDKT